MKKNKNKNDKIIKTSIIMPVAIAYGFFCTHAFASPITEENVANLVNQERTKRNLPALKLDSELDLAATNKSRDMINRNYFDHFAKGLSPWDFIEMAGYDYLYAGENLAMDFNTSEGMVNAWMNSPLHRDNILSPDYTEMGIGIVKGAYVESGTSHDTIMVDNMFGRKKPSIIKFFDSITRTLSNIF